MKYLNLLLLILISASVSAQTKLPVIKATSRRVAIKDGEVLDKNAWSLSPKIKLDVYTAERTRKAKYVTFYTDIDSIKVKVKPGSRFDFVAILNGKDSCFTRIESAVPPEQKQLRVAHDTIPFILTAHEAISFKAVVNDKDTVLLHFDTGSWGLRLTKDAIINKTGLLTDRANPDFEKLAKVTKLQIGSLTYTNPEFEMTGNTARDMDGRFGWTLFEGKQVELDFDKSLMIVHSGKLIKAPKGYVRSELNFDHSFMIVKGFMIKGSQQLSGNFLMDTGAESSIILDSTWAARTQFASGLPLLRTIVLHDPRGNEFKTQVVQAPAFELNGLKLQNVPTQILGTRNPTGLPLNYLGGGVLKRFNMILDFKNDCIYWKPNKLFNTPFKS
ncbi:hypothetical protein [Mucilaginibacter conchicola]|nr:hypothetical protein [Mucilaginibacter conchicola]